MPLSSKGGSVSYPKGLTQLQIDELHRIGGLGNDPVINTAQGTVNAAGATVNAVSNTVNAVGTAASSTASFFDHLGSLQLWKGIGLIVAGALVLVFAAMQFGRIAGAPSIVPV